MEVLKTTKDPFRIFSIEDNQSPIEILPDELLLRIFLFLGVNTLVACSFVNKKWYRIGNDDTLWKVFFRSHFQEGYYLAEAQSSAINYKNEYAKFWTIESGFYSSPLYFDIKIIRKFCDDAWMVGTLNDLLYLYNYKKNACVPFDPNTLEFIDSLEISLTPPEKFEYCYCDIHKQLLLSVYRNKQQDLYQINVWNAHKNELIAKFTFNEVNDCNFFIYENFLFVLTGIQMHQWEIDVLSKKENKILTIETDAICMKWINKDFFVFGCNNGSVKIWNNDTLQTIQTNKEFVASEIDYFPNNILMIKYEANYNNIFLSYANFYKLSLTPNIEIKKIYSTLNQSNSNCKLTEIILVRNKIIFSIYDKSKDCITLNSYCLENNWFMEITEIPDDEQKVIKLVWLNGALYICLESESKYSIEKWNFYKFDQYLDLIISGYNKIFGENPLLVTDEDKRKLAEKMNTYLSVHLDLFLPNDMEDIRFCRYLNQPQKNFSEEDTKKLWQRYSTFDEKYQALLIYRQYKGWYLNGSSEGRQHLKELFNESNNERPFKIQKIK